VKWPSVSLSKDHPLIESGFGPIGDDLDRTLFAILAKVDRELVALATKLGPERTDERGVGLKLVWMPSGQVELSSFVSGSDNGGHMVDFGVELRPAWFYGHRTGVAGWVIAASVDAHCKHAVDHGGTDTVWNRGDVRRSTPEDAANELLVATIELRKLGTDQPLDHWLSLARD